MTNTEKYLRLKKLLQKLSPSQKRDFRHFVKFWSAEKTPHYAVLFEALLEHFSKAPAHVDEAEELDFQRFLAVFQQKNFAQKGSKKANRRAPEPTEATDFFSKNAAYLFEKILENHRERAQEGQLRRRIRSAMADVNALLEFGFFDDALDLCESLLAEARRLPQPTLVLELLRVKRRIFVMHIDVRRSRDLLAALDEITAEEVDLLLDLDEITVLTAFSNRFFACGVEKKAPEKAEIEAFLALDRKFEKLEKAGGGERLFSPGVRHAWLSARLFFANLDGGEAAEKAKLETQTAIFELFDGSLEMRTDEPLRYRSCLANLIMLRLRRPELAVDEALFEKLEAAYPNRLEVIENVHFLRLLHLIQQKNFAQARAFIVQNRLIETLEKQKSQFSQPRLASIWYTLAMVFFTLEEHDRANICLNRLLFDLPKKANMEAKTMGNSLRLALHFETGSFVSHNDPGHVFRQLNGLEKSGHCRPEAFEKAFWAHLETIANGLATGQSEKARLGLFAAARAELLPLTDVENSRFFFVEWLAAKANGLSLGAFFEQKKAEKAAEKAT